MRETKIPMLHSQKKTLDPFESFVARALHVASMMRIDYNSNERVKKKPNLNSIFLSLLRPALFSRTIVEIGRKKESYPLFTLDLREIKIVPITRSRLHPRNESAGFFFGEGKKRSVQFAKFNRNWA